MAPYWSSGQGGQGGQGRHGQAGGAPGPQRRASTAGTPSALMAGPLGRKTSSAGEAYHRIVSSTRNPLYGMTTVGHVGLADSVAGSASDDTSGGSSSGASASRHYVDPWDLENFMYLKRHWAAEDGEHEAESSTPALESGAQSDFYYVGPSRAMAAASRASPSPTGLDVDLELEHLDPYRSVYRPDSVLLEPLALGPASMGVLNAVEEESFFNERFDPALQARLEARDRHLHAQHRHVRRSHSAAATYLHDALPPRGAAGTAPSSAYAGRRRSVACAPRYYRTPITGGDSSGEYEAFEDYADELSRRLDAVDLLEREVSAAPPGPRSKRHSVAVSRPRPATSHAHQMPRSRASIAGPAPALPPPARLSAASVRRRHSHCVAWPAPSAAPSAAPSPAHIYSTRRASFSRGQLLAGLHATHQGRYASDLAYMGGGVYGAPAATPYGSNPYGTAGSSDDCYVSDASEDYTDGPADGVVAAPAPAAAAGVPRRGDAVVDGFTDADLMYAQLASSLYGADTPYGYCGSSGPAAGLSGYDCSRFQLTNYGHLKIDYSCSWRSLDAYIAHS